MTALVRRPSKEHLAHLICSLLNDHWPGVGDIEYTAGSHIGKQIRVPRSGWVPSAWQEGKVEPQDPTTSMQTKQCMQGESNIRQFGGKEEQREMEQGLLESFLSKPRRTPARPAWSRTSTLIIRKEALPFYYAIYDHEQGRFTELQYRSAPLSPLRIIQIPLSGTNTASGDR